MNHVWRKSEITVSLESDARIVSTNKTDFNWKYMRNKPNKAEVIGLSEILSIKFVPFVDTIRASLSRLTVYEMWSRSSLEKKALTEHVERLLSTTVLLI